MLKRLLGLLVAGLLGLAQTPFASAATVQKTLSTQAIDFNGEIRMRTSDASQLSNGLSSQNLQMLLLESFLRVGYPQLLQTGEFRTLSEFPFDIAGFTTHPCFDILEGEREFCEEIFGFTKSLKEVFGTDIAELTRLLSEDGVWVLGEQDIGTVNDGSEEMDDDEGLSLHSESSLIWELCGGDRSCYQRNLRLRGRGLDIEVNLH